MLIFLIFYAPIIMNRVYISSVLRTKNQKFFRTTLIFSGLVFPIGTFSLNYVLINYLNGSVYHVLIGFIAVDTSIYLYYHYLNHKTKEYESNSSQQDSYLDIT